MSVTRPLIATVGGLWTVPDTQREAAKATARAIGSALARNGFNLVVYFSNEMSIEPHVVSGYVGDAGETGRIHVRYALSQRGEVHFNEEKQQPELFRHQLFPTDDWSLPFYRSLAEEDGVDAILLVAGGASTYIAGQIAVARKLPVLVVNEFGGAAAKIWTEIGKTQQSQSYQDLVAQLRSECDASATALINTRHQAEALRKLTSVTSKTYWTAGAFIALLTTLLFGMVYVPYPAMYPAVVLLGLTCAGATGSLARALVWAKDTDPRTSLVLGAIAGLVVGLAYTVPQWIGAPEVLSADSTAVSTSDKIQFASAILVSISAGVGFDTVFNRLKQQADSAPVAVTK